MREALGTSSQVAHVWAQQTQEHGRGGTRDNIFFHGPALYSYGTHFLLAYIMPDGVALLNTDTYSVTTSKHKGEARNAARHRQCYPVPALTAMLYTLQDAGRLISGKPLRADRASVRKAVAAALYDRAGNIADESALYLAGVAGIPARQWEAIKARRAKADAKAKAEADRREVEMLTGQAAEMADMDLAAFRATFPDDGDSDYHKRRYRAFSSRVAKLHKIAKAKLGKRRTAKAWEKVKAWREHVGGVEGRLVAAHVGALVARYRQWEAGEADRPDAYKYDSSHPELAGMKATIEADETATRTAEARRDYAAWKAGTAGRPERWIAYLSDAEQADIDADIAAELEATAKAYELWRDDKTQPRPDSSPFLSKLRERYPTAWNELSSVESAERAERARSAKLAAVETWRNGGGRPDDLPRSVAFPPHDDGQGGALLRVRGGLLETSQGASVPLREAVRVFQFAKLCRQRGQGWRRNGASLPVGHFQVDRVEADGSFVAGCHRINWPEIERAAAQADVLTAEPSDAALERSAA